MTDALHPLERLVQRAELLMARIEQVLPQPMTEPDWSASVAFRYRKRNNGRGGLEPVRHVAKLGLADLQEIDGQKEKIQRNTEQFVKGLPANNVLLTGARGTGKSSLIKACLNEYGSQGLRLIEVDKDDLTDLPDIIELVSERPEKFMIFCDDLSFEDGEVHPGEGVEEKISLSERFGLWVSFYPFSQDEYLTIAAQWLASFGVKPAEIEAAKPEALVWALERASRSGRVAYQFARDYAGKHAA